MAKKKNSVVKKEAAGLPAHLEEEMEADAGDGRQGITTKDLAIPFLRILQKMSPQLSKRDGAYIEGAEEELLDPDLAPALRKLDIIVESHECLRKGITQKLISRFEATHTIEIIEDNGSRQLDNPPAWFKKLSHLDQLLATWEWRSGPTPWLVMSANSKAAC